MDVYFFFKQRTDLIRHFYDAASTPFLETKKCIEDARPPFDNPPYDDSGEPAFLSEWLRADVEHELIGRTAVSMLSEALKQFFVTWERKTWAKPPCAKCFNKAFESGFIAGYIECFSKSFDIDWSTCPADLEILKQVVLARNRAQHSDLVMDHLAHDEKSLRAHPRPFFVRPEDEGLDLAESSILSPTIHISREKLLEAIDHAERLASWLQERIEEHRARKWAQRQTT
ncbi:hypothetical protein LZ683_17510 [Comamonas testosteroni]|uniref:hypothetical protein n=1 Tax=Comamonas testosteroni TaxID=285 RepID=UPI0023AB451F|nr:hypothetical protein [Comamonas testosteroni]WEE75953.1 hypothetical protein LZ683_17510 [Comamonas testosteroni]